jgi:hypothetical protein
MEVAKEYIFITALGKRRYLFFIFFLPVVQRPYSCLGCLLVEASGSHSDTPQSVGLLWEGICPSQKPLPDNTNINKRQSSMTTAEFEPAIPASERPQAYASDLVATGIDLCLMYILIHVVST